MRAYTSPIIVLGTLFAMAATSVSARTWNPEFDRPGNHGTAPVHAEHHGTLAWPAPVFHEPTRTWMARYARCIGGYEYTAIAPYQQGRPAYEACPVADATPIPHPRPGRASGAGSSPPMPPDVTIVTLENSLVGASAAALSVSLGATGAPHRDRRYSVQPRAVHKASNAVAKHVAKKILIRAVPVVGTAFLLYELAGFID